ncbi:DNA-binding response regulator [Chitinophaga silvatica]|uniref:DNA-binding response regulator n=2 Tax=Chitinophaga silvatica TaxID=2282649 RepID=A0A3E1Y9C6_9BACT|nr:DNA-binding response regulator [Chitinophaga silvatica]
MIIDGLKTMLAEIPEIQVLFTCANGTTLLELLQHEQPDILLLDIQLPDVHGVELSREVLKYYPDLRILALTNHDNSHLVWQMLRSGALGYLLKNTNINTLRQAIQALSERNRFIDPQLEERLVLEAITRQRISNSEVPLTENEAEILKLIAEEMSTQEISERLSISSRTAEKHRSNIIQKLGIKNVAGLVREAYKRGLI